MSELPEISAGSLRADFFFGMVERISVTFRGAVLAAFSIFDALVLTCEEFELKDDVA
jgi:hypothetical protein